MSHQNLADAFAPAEAVYRSRIMYETWGHLCPVKNTTYYGFVVFAVGCFGSDHLNPTVIACEFKTSKRGKVLDSSPWFYHGLQDFVQTRRGKEGNVYRFDGTFRNYEFKGKIRKVYSSAQT